LVGGEEEEGGEEHPADERDEAHGRASPSSPPTSLALSTVEAPEEGRAERGRRGGGGGETGDRRPGRMGWYFVRMVESVFHVLSQTRSVRVGERPAAACHAQDASVARWVVAWWAPVGRGGEFQRVLSGILTMDKAKYGPENEHLRCVEIKFGTTLFLISRLKSTI